MDKTKRQLVALLLLVLVVAVVGDIVSASIAGSSAVAPSSIIKQKQSGSSSCNIAAGGIFCSVTINFSPAFSTIPSVAVTDILTTLSNQGFFAGTASFIATDPAVVWTGMPRSLTEFLGTSNHRLAIDTSLGLTAVRFQAICTVASTNSTAFIGIQESVNAGVSWTDLSASFHLGISNQHCPGLVDSGLAGIAIVGSVNALFRVFGQNGNGVGDNPAFTSITLTLNGVINMSPFHCGVDTVGGFPTTTQMIILCNALSTTGIVQPAPFEWQAEVA